jgi:hypothetical protein
MLRLFRAGAVAACLQCVLILLITPLVLAGWRYGMNVQRFPDADSLDIRANAQAAAKAV